jgi:ribosome recycling factor
MPQKTLLEAEERMKKAIEAVRREMAKIRTGKATPALLDTVRVDYYGSPTALQKVASVSAPEARLLVVQPYERTMVKAVSKAIQVAELGLNPTDDGTVIRIPIPTLTEERRREMTKLLGKLAEEGRVHVRLVRHDVNKDVKHREDGGEVSQDEAKRLGVEVQKLTDRYIEQVDELLKKKTAEVMEV